MNDFGMIINNEYGQERLTINDRTIRLAGSFMVEKNDVGIYEMEGISGKDPYAFVSVYNMSITPPVFPHIVSISGDTIFYNKVSEGFNFDTGPSIVWIYVTA